MTPECRYDKEYRQYFQHNVVKTTVFSGHAQGELLS